MPGKDGFEVLREIRKLNQKMFIVAISNNELYLRAIKKLGANEALPGSINPDVIINAVSNSIFALH